MERYGGGKIEVCDYDPTWPEKFEHERARLGDTLGSLALTIEHVGSTAVPGLAAKPIIDMLVSVRSLAGARELIRDPLADLGYRHMVEYEAWLSDELLFRRGMPGPWTHHVHVVEPASARWEELIVIRDYLRRHPETAATYGDLKMALAVEFGEDIEGFREAKRPFMQALLANARSERSSTS
jgi:GrpB-like predicted nucleotidyltransferase (UPF0157 family)